MQSELQCGFDAIERQRAALQNNVLALSDTQRDWSPKTDVWSVRQIVEHLVLSDETVGRAQDANAIKPEALMFRVLPRAWRRALVLRALRRDAVLPLPSPGVEPCGNAPLPELLARWEGARGEMRRVLDTLRGDEKRYAHPELGPLTAAQMLELGETHTAYHTRQLEALQRDPNFPRPS